MQTIKRKLRASAIYTATLAAIATLLLITSSNRTGVIPATIITALLAFTPVPLPETRKARKL